MLFIHREREISVSVIAAAILAVNQVWLSLNCHGYGVSIMHTQTPYTRFSDPVSELITFTHSWLEKCVGFSLQQRDIIIAQYSHTHEHLLHQARHTH